jgi:hypothetical protein
LKKQYQHKSSSFNPNIPIVHHLSCSVLKDLGYIKYSVDVEHGKQTMVTTYKNGDKVVTYNGTDWVQNGLKIHFVEDIQ